MEKDFSRTHTSSRASSPSWDPTRFDDTKPPWHRGPGPTFRFMLLSWFGCGLSPKAPGTAGSAGALPLGLALYWAYGSTILAASAIGLFFLGWITARIHLREDDSAKDPQWIVVDEVVGQWIALAAVPIGLPVGLFTVPLAFGLFRLFDIKKPWPVSWADQRVGGALGIMLDDLLAGLYAAGVGFGVVAAFRAIWT